MTQIKSEQKTRASLPEVAPPPTLARRYADVFEHLESAYADDDLEADAVKSLCTTAGSLVSMALDAGLFAEYRNSLEIEYQHGLIESESKGWLRLWQKLTDILRLRRGLSILTGTFPENCRLAATRLEKEALEGRAGETGRPKKRPRGVLDEQVASLIEAGESSSTRMADILNKNYERTYSPTSRKSIEGTSAYKKYANKKKNS